MIFIASFRKALNRVQSGSRCVCGQKMERLCQISHHLLAFHLQISYLRTFLPLIAWEDPHWLAWWLATCCPFWKWQECRCIHDGRCWTEGPVLPTRMNWLREVLLLPAGFLTGLHTFQRVGTLRPAVAGGFPASSPLPGEVRSFLPHSGREHCLQVNLPLRRPLYWGPSWLLSSSGVSLCFPGRDSPVSPLKARQLLSAYSTSSEPGPPMLSPVVLTISPRITFDYASFPRCGWSSDIQSPMKWVSEPDLRFHSPCPVICPAQPWASFGDSEFQNWGEQLTPATK